MSTILLAIALLVLAGFFLFALCSNLIYWYETLNTPDERIPSPRLGAAECIRHYLASLKGYFLCVGVFPAAPLVARKIGREKPGADPSLPPVILVHGLNNNAAVWLYLAPRLEKAGYRVSTYSYWSFFKSREKILAGLERQVRRAEVAYPGQKPVFVCHSLGGLFARYWLMAEGNDARISGLITLGTPHAGSKLAALAPGRTGQSIRPDSEFIATLRQGAEEQAKRLGEAGKGPCLTALASPTDEAVLPASCLVPPAGWALRITPKTGHFTMLFTDRVADMVLEELRACAARR